MEIILNSQRFDLMAKYLYIKHYDKNLNCSFFKDLYIKHFITFNNCFEYPDPHLPNGNSKKTPDDFIKEFNLLIENMKNNGFDSNYPIPIGNNNIIINGAHRLITSYYLNINPVFKKCNENGNPDYNYNFFLNRPGTNPSLDRLYSDTMALEYIKHNQNIRAMIVYPTAFTKNKIKNVFDIIQQYGYIYYKKIIKLNKNGINNLVKEIYRGEEWIGGLFPQGYSPGGKAMRCVTEKDFPTILILIEMKDLNKCVELKEKCRELFDLGKHSVHISDYTEDTYRIGSSLLNENSIHFLNNGTNDIPANTKTILQTIFNENCDNKENICINNNISNKLFNINSDSNTNKNYLISNNYNDETIYNPNHFFYFNSFKFKKI